MAFLALASKFSPNAAFCRGAVTNRSLRYGQRRRIGTTPLLADSCTATDSEELYPHQQQDTNQPKRKKDRPRLPILKYCNDWVCINKPAGMTMHRKHTRKHSPDPVVTTTLKRQLARKIFPVHRLDHRTSGALLFATSSETAAFLHSTLKHNAEKTYIALVRGHWDYRFAPERAQVDHVSVKDDGSVLVDKPLNIEGTPKESRTIFRKLATGTCFIPPSCLDQQKHQLDNPDDFSACMPCTLVQDLPQTGRTHQIRRHAYHMGLPVLGDTQHGDSKVNRWWRTYGDLNRLALHCLAIDNLQVPPESTGRSSDDYNPRKNNKHDAVSTTTSIVAPLPEDLRYVLEEKLPELWEEATLLEPRLKTPFYDIKGGTLGVSKKWQRERQVEQETSGTD